MATPTSITVIDPNSDSALAKQAIALTTANGGVYVFETSKDIYVTSVTENVTNQSVFPSYSNVFNLPGAVPNGVQFNQNGAFQADPQLTYTNQTLYANAVNAHAVLTDNLYYANGLPWDFGNEIYGNSQVANFLPTFTGNLTANNVGFTGVVNLGDVSNVNIFGGNLGEALVTSGTGNLAFVPVPYGGNLSNGNSKVFVYGNTNVAVTVNAVSNVAVFTTTGLNVAGNISATAVNAQVVVGNSSIVLTNANITLTANTNAIAVVSGTGVNVAGYITATGNITAPNLVGVLANGNSNISITGNGNVVINSGSNAVLTVSPTGVTATANITGTNFIGKLANGSANVSVVANGNVVVSAGGSAGILTVSAAGTDVIGNSNVTGNLSISGSLNISGGLNANIANGSSNVRIAANGNVSISSGGNSNVFVVTNANTVTTGEQIVIGNVYSERSVYIGNSNPNSGLVFKGANAGNLANVRVIGIYPGTSVVADYSLVLPNNLPSSNGLVLGSNTDGQLYWTTGALTNSIVNGNSNVFVSANGNITTSVAGNANILVVTGTGANVAGTLTATGNVRGSNLTTTGVVTATGNVSGGNLTTGGVVAATGNVRAANIIANVDIITVAGNANIAGNITAVGNISTTANIGAGNLTVSGQVSTTGQVYTTGNITGSNITTNGTATLATISSNTDASFSGNLTANGNVNLGDLSNITIGGGSNNQILTTDGNGVLTWTGGGGGSGSNIANGTSNVAILLNSNVIISAAGNANIVTVTGTGVNVAGTLTVTGNTTVSNLTANGNVSLGAVANVRIANGSSGQALITDGAGNLSWATVGNTGVITAISNGTSNVSVLSSGGNVAVGINGTANSLVVGSGGITTGNITGTGIVTANGMSIGNNTSGIASISLQYLYVGANGFGGEIRLYNNTASKYTSISASGDIITTDGSGSLSGNWTVGGNLITTSITANSGSTIDFSNTAQVKLGAVGNVKITGGNVSNGAVFLQTDGTGNLTWGTPSNSISSISTNNTNVRTFTSNIGFSVNNQANLIYFDGNGITVTGLVGRVSATTVVASGDVTANNINATTDASIGANLLANNVIASSNIKANGYFIGLFDANSNAQPNITSLGTLVNVTVTGNILGGNVYANSGTVRGNLLTGTLTTAAQPNVTSVGNLTNLTVTGNANIGNVVRFNGAVATGNGNIDLSSSALVTLPSDANIILGGGTNGQFLQQLGGGQVQWADVLASNAAPPTAGSNGAAGTIAFASGYLYICVATDTWKRVAVTTF